MPRLSVFYFLTVVVVDGDLSCREGAFRFPEFFCCRIQRKTETENILRERPSVARFLFGYDFFQEMIFHVKRNVVAMNIVNRRMSLP